MLAILGDRLAPWLGDLYLAKTGFSSQQTPAPADPDRPDNLFEPVQGDPGAHGRFDAEAHESAPTAWLSSHRDAIAAAAGAVLAGAGLAGLRRG